MKKHLFKGLFIALLAMCVHTQQSHAAVEGFVTRLNIIFQDGTVMFYTGGNAGLIAGEEYFIIANGVKLATIRLTRVDDYSANALILSADGPLQEGVMYTFKYASQQYFTDYIEPKKVKKIGGESSSASAPAKKTDAKKDTTAKKDSSASAKKEDSTASSKRRSQASGKETAKADDDSGELKEKEAPAKEKPSRRTGGDEDKPAKTETKTAKKDDKKKEDTKKKDTGKKETAKTTAAGPHVLTSAVSLESSTGMNLLPTADVLEEDQARVAASYHMIFDDTGYVSAVDEVGGLYSGRFQAKERNISYYFTYGLNKNLETTVTSTETREANNMNLNAEHSRLSGIGFKYRFTLGDEKDKTPVHLGAILEWKKGREKGSKVADNSYEESNLQGKAIKYGLIGSITCSDLAKVHLYYARERWKYSEPSYSDTASYSIRNTTRGIGLSYVINPLTDLLLEYKVTDDDSNSDFSNLYDYKIKEKSLGLRYKLKPYLLLDGAYIIHDANAWYYDSDDTHVYRVHEDIDDGGWMLKLNYLL